MIRYADTVDPSVLYLQYGRQTPARCVDHDRRGEADGRVKAIEHTRGLVRQRAIHFDREALPRQSVHDVQRARPRPSASVYRVKS